MIIIIIEIIIIIIMREKIIMDFFREIGELYSENKGKKEMSLGS